MSAVAEGGAVRSKRCPCGQPRVAHGGPAAPSRLLKARVPEQDAPRSRGFPGEGTAMSDIAKPAARKYGSFAEFYPFYLSEHSDRTCRRLHFAGSSLALLCVVAAIVTRNPWWLLAALLCGYGFAWIGHFAFEKNQPASFKQPLYSFMGDWRMYWQILTGKIAF
jgi:hypothetical protein